MKLNHSSFFTGIGGFDLGFELAGIGTVSQCEIDKHACSTLEKHWPGVERYNDITTVKLDRGSADIISGGFPCQDISVAGNRKGLAGERSGLFYELVRVVDECKPKYVVWENVPGLLSSNGGADFKSVIREFAEIGYSGAWRVLDSQYFGVAQRRRRIFGVFAQGDSGWRRAGAILFEPESGRRNTAPCRSEKSDSSDGIKDGAGTISGRVDRDVAFTLKHHQGSPNADQVTLIPCCWNGEQVSDTLDVSVLSKQQMMPEKSRFAAVLDNPDVSRPLIGTADKHDDSRETYIVAPTLSTKNEMASSSTTREEWYETSAKLCGKVRRLTPDECEKLQGFPVGWTAGQVDTHRYKQLGNAVTVNVAYWIALRLKQVEEYFEANRSEK